MTTREHFGVTADDVIKFEDEHSFRYLFCDIHDGNDNKIYLAVMFYAASTGHHEQFYLTPDEAEKYYDVHEFNEMFDTDYRRFRDYVNSVA